MNKSTIVWLTCLLLLSVSACQATQSEPESEPVIAKAPVLATVLPQETPAPPVPNEEIASAIAYGIVPEELQQDYDAVITSSEFCRMLSRVIEQVDATKLSSWENVAKAALSSSQEMKREDAMIAVYEAACTLGVGVDTNGSWYETDRMTEGSAHFWELSYDYPAWTNLEDTSPFCTGSDNMICGAYHYAQGQCSPFSGKRLFDLDEAYLDFHMLDRLHRTGAIEIAVRFYESVATEQIENAAVAVEREALAALTAQRRNAILTSESDYTAAGTVYYVSNGGDDANDGLSPETAWATLDKVNSCAWTQKEQLNSPDFPEFLWAGKHPDERADLKDGDVVLFERGGLWRGMLRTTAGVTYSAYDAGEKPRIYGSPEDGADESKWTLVDGTSNIWKFHNPMQQVGIILCDGETVALRDYAYWDGKKHIKMNSNAEYDWAEVEKLPELTPQSITENLHFFCDVRSPNNFSNPATYGDLYLRCDGGNPGALFSSMEFATGNDAWYLALASLQNGAILDNLCFRFGSSGVIAHSSEGAIIRNCEIAWIGGMNMNPDGITDQPKRCTLMSNGDAIMIGGVNNSAIHNYISHTFDYGITVEALTGNPDEPYRSGCTASGNLLEKCNGGLLVVDWNAIHAARNAPIFTDITLEDNIVADTACCEWAHYDQRYDEDGNYLLEGEGCGALGLWINPGCKNIVVRDNVFAFTYQRENLIHIARFDGDMSWLLANGNTYLAKAGESFLSINDYSSTGDEARFPKYLFDGVAAKTVREQLGDDNGKTTLAPS